MSLWLYSLGLNGSAHEMNLPDTKVAFSDRQFQSCIANALEDCPSVQGKVRSIIGCDSNIIRKLSTLARFDNWVQVLAHAARKSRHRSVETLCKSFVGISSASKIECKHFHRTLVRYLQAMLSLRAVKLAE